MKVKLMFAGLETVINESDLAVDNGGVIDIDFNGEMLVQFTKEKFVFNPTNAVNGWGYNCFEEVKDEELTIEILD